MTTPFSPTSPPVPQQQADVQVRVQPLPLVTSDNGAQYVPQPLGSTWTDFQIKHRYEKDYHRYMMGITSPGGFLGRKAAFVQLAAPTLLWIADWTACRFGTQPLIPDPLAVSGEWVLLDELPETVVIITSPDGSTPIYRVTGTYIYGHTGPSDNTFDNVVFPRSPWYEDTFDRTVPATTLTPNLLTITGNNSSFANAGTPGTLPPAGNNASFGN